ncbi:hypothetical protein [Candidatus Enterovibrio escicola]|uniref:hypothetical protein n=1 Tax=Candidatus Enterovibrio escicola TaxID=1927127 RepID=UPI001237CF91|nr:hypothetical protein [Candidatus Enterovibrio escacola]
MSEELALKYNVVLNESTIYQYIWHNRDNVWALYKDLLHKDKPYKIKISINDKIKTKTRVGIKQHSDIYDEKIEFDHYDH